MAGKKSRERESGWRKLVDRQPGSGLSIREYCVRAGISQPSFYAWRRKFQEQDRAQRQDQVARQDGAEPWGGRSSEKSKGSSEFIPLRLGDVVVSELVVIHPLGYQVRVKGDVNRAALGQVLEVLDGRRGE